MYGKPKICLYRLFVLCDFYKKIIYILEPYQNNFFIRIEGSGMGFMIMTKIRPTQGLYFYSDIFLRVDDHSIKNYNILTYFSDYMKPRLKKQYG